MIQVKRVYDASVIEDGFRVFVERFWPRDLTEKHAKLDLWLQEVAPPRSFTELSGRIRTGRGGMNFSDFIGANSRTSTSPSSCCETRVGTAC